jgi:hypothetical protein
MEYKLKPTVQIVKLFEDFMNERFKKINEICPTIDILTLKKLWYTIYSKNQFKKYISELKNKLSGGKNKSPEKEYRYRYNLSFLLAYCKKHNIILNKDYTNTKMIRDTKIDGKCCTKNCLYTFNKSFRALTISGGYCVSCTKKAQVIKTHPNTDKNKIVIYDMVLFKKYISDNDIQLTECYTNIKCNTHIKGRCLNKCKNINIFKGNNKCNETFIKTFESLIKTGAYCRSCSFKNSVDKYRITVLEKYKVENVSQLDEIKQKKVETCFKNHNVNFPMQSQVIKDKSSETLLKNYNVKSPMQSDIVKNKAKETIKNYGPDFYQSVNLKRQATMMELYGVKHSLQNQESASKAFNNSYRIKLYEFPSGNTRRYQGYEKFALDELIKTYTEEEIVSETKNVPRILYTNFKNSESYHYVDIYIPSENRCIEIKSDWTLKNKNTFLKQKSAKDLGMKYEIWVYDKKGIKTNVYY